MAAASKGWAGSAKAGAAAGSQRSLPPLVVSYMRRMKPQRVYSIDVRWQHAAKPAVSSSSVVVRLVMAGAQVVPSERTMDPGRPKERAQFYVTPLARGWLRGERLEVLVDGRKVQEIRLPSKAVSQRATWALLLLTILLPWQWSSWIQGTKKSEIAGKQETKKDDPPGNQAAGALAQNFPPLPDVVVEYTEKLPEGQLRSFVENLEDTPGLVKACLNWLHYKSLDSQKQGYPLPGLIAYGMLALTLVSWWLHREKRKRRAGQPIPMPEATEGEGPGRTTRSGQVAPVESFG
jgi:hypothetical protein